MKSKKSTSSSSFVFKVSVILILTASGMIKTVNTFDIPGFKDLIGLGCSAIVGVSTIQPCTEEFSRTMEPYMAKTTESVEDKSNYRRITSTSSPGQMPVWIYCCAVTTLRYCVIDKIGKACGTDAETTANSLVGGIVGAVKLIDGEQPCDGNEIYFRKESPLCWDWWGPLTGVAIMAVLLLTTCCCCCICCCRGCCRRKGQTIIRIVQPGNAPTVDYTPLREMA